MTRRRLLITLIASLLALAGCDDSTSGGGNGPRSCSNADDCSGADCINGLCAQTPCGTAGDCNGADCLNGFCTLQPCATQSDCVGGGDCVSGVCVFWTNADARELPGQDTRGGVVDTLEDSGADTRDTSVGFDGNGISDAPFGALCATHDNCASGVCLPLPSGDSICTESCEESCPHQNFTCDLLEDDAGVQQRLCVFDRGTLCEVCKRDEECLVDGALCLTLTDGPACATPCGPDGLCAIGYSCEDHASEGLVFAVCVPDVGLCQGCADEDGDGHGVGNTCLGFDCDDDDDTTYEGADERCDGVDNDCDLQIDEGLQENACGGCEVLVAAPGDACGVCELGEQSCEGTDLVCAGDEPCPIPVVVASDGARADVVEVSWTLPATAEAFRVFRDGDLVAQVDGGTFSLEDPGAGAGSTPEMPGGLSATDGDYIDRVDLSWSAANAQPGPAHAYTVVAVLGAFESDPSLSDDGHRAGEPITQYELSLDGGPWSALGDVLTTSDTTAPAPFVTPGAADASDGASLTHVTLALDGASATPGATVSYRVRAINAAGIGAASDPDDGHRGVGPMSLQWERSALDSDANYSDLGGATSSGWDDATAPADGSGRFYRARVSAAGAADALSSSDRGFRGVSTCGNGATEPGEQCDDGNNLNNDGCDSGCVIEVCGDSVVQTGLGEVCDDGVNNNSYDGCAPGCGSFGPFCGDGTNDPQEACDDGVNNGGYNGCEPGCLALDRFCGDGVNDPEEACDDGVNDDSYGGCASDCQTLGPFCGDGVNDPEEACDDGVNDGSYDSCTPDCQGFGPFCGDGALDPVEVCDDGVNDGSYDGCAPGCASLGPFCGDGAVDAPEECDDGNANDTDDCANDCTSNNVAITCGPVNETSNGLLGAVTLSGAVTINTDAGTIVDGSGTVVSSGSPGVTITSQPPFGPFSSPDIVAFHFTDLNIPSGVTVSVTGSRSLALLATGDIDIGGSIDLSGSNATSGAVNSAGSKGFGGAGGWDGGNFVSGPGCASGNGLADGPGRGNEGGCGSRGGDGADAASSSTGGGGGGGGSCGGSGGAGAGHAIDGGDGLNGVAGTLGDPGNGGGGSGGSACASPPFGSIGGPAVGDSSLSILMGGSGGSSGGFGALGGFGGDGGDGPTGGCLNNFGGLGGQSGGGGGGGGGGGAILVCASSTVTLTGSIDASGGNGGGGGFSDIAESGGNAFSTSGGICGGGGGAGRSGRGGGGGAGAGGAIFLRAPTVALQGGSNLNSGGGLGGFASSSSSSGGFGGLGANGGASGGRGGSGGGGGEGGDGGDGYIRVEADSVLRSGITDGVYVEGPL